MTFDEIRSRIQALFPFEISLNFPYKLCDYKPVYGDVFREYFEGYDFWGYADLDLVFGNLRYFLTDEILNKYDKIYHQAHLSLYRNCEMMNKLYLSVLPDGKAFDYKFVYQTEHPCFFDEHCGMERIIKYKNISMYTWNMGVDKGVLADISPFHKCFKFSYRGEELSNALFEYRQGNLYLAANSEERIPTVYAHFAKRKFEVSTSDTDNFNIVPNTYTDSTAECPSFTEAELREYEVKFTRDFRASKIKRAFKLGIWKYIQKVVRKKNFMPLD